MKFVIVGDRFSTLHGGVEQHSSTLAAELSKRGHLVNWIERDDVIREDILDSTDYLLIEGVRRKRIWALLGRMNRDLLQRTALFTHGSFFEFTHRVELIRLGYYGGLLTSQAKTLFDYAITFKRARKFLRVYVLSELERDDLVGYYGLPRDKVRVSSNFLQPLDMMEPPSDLNTDSWAAPFSHRRFILGIGRIEQRKNFIAAVKAAHLLGENIVLVGRDCGALRGIRRFVAQKGMSGFTHLESVTTAQKRALIAIADALVIPSFVEGIPYVMLEAQTMGVPVICTRMSYVDKWRNVIPCDPTTTSVVEAIQTLRKRENKAERPIVPSGEQVVTDLIDDLTTGSTYQ